jgi:transposase-like protein
VDKHSTQKAQIIQLNESVVRDHPGEMVNSMLDSEADRLCNAEKYQRNEARTDTRAGHYLIQNYEFHYYSFVSILTTTDIPGFRRSDSG